VLLAGCRLDLDVHVAVEPDGGGQVEVVIGLDEDGIERIGGDLREVLEVDDLAEAGWTVSQPALGDEGITSVRVVHPFADAEEAAAAFEEIAGPAGPFRDLALERSTGFARTRWTFTGRIDFGGGAEAFSDAAVAAELDGVPLGQSVEDIEAQLGEPLSEVIEVGVAVDLPHAPPAEWRVPFGGEPVALHADSEETRTATLVGAGVAVASVAGWLLYGLWRLWSSSHRRATAA
jgi:hypothetical protein